MNNNTYFHVLSTLLFVVQLFVAKTATGQPAKYDFNASFGGDVKSVSARIATMYGADAPTVERFVQAAIDLENRIGIAAPVVIAIAIHESSFKSELFTNAGNPFGIKASKPWGGPSFTKWDDGMKSKFRAYSSAEEAIGDFGDFVKSRSWYADAFICPINDSRCVVDSLKKTDSEPGYSMDPNWDEAVMGIIQKMRLQELASH